MMAWIYIVLAALFFLSSAGAGVQNFTKKLILFLCLLYSYIYIFSIILMYLQYVLSFSFSNLSSLVLCRRSFPICVCELLYLGGPEEIGKTA